jgi:hypothetical protein
MGEQRDQYRSKDRRDGHEGYGRCRWHFPSRPRQLRMAERETDEALELWYRGEPMPAEEQRLRRSVPPAYRGMPWFVLADYLEERGRIEEADYLRRFRATTYSRGPAATAAPLQGDDRGFESRREYLFPMAVER